MATESMVSNGIGGYKGSSLHHQTFKHFPSMCIEMSEDVNIHVCFLKKSNYIELLYVDVITYSCPNLEAGLANFNQ